MWKEVIVKMDVMAKTVTEDGKERKVFVYAHKPRF